MRTNPIGCIATDRRKPRETIFGRVENREDALPGICGRLHTTHLALGDGRPVDAANRFSGACWHARCPFPLHLGWQRPTEPLCVSSRISIGDANNRVGIAPLKRRLWSLRLAPACIATQSPPLRSIVSTHDGIGLLENGHRWSHHRLSLRR